MSKKHVIVFEGIEGSGKSYHILNVSKHLTKNKIDHIKKKIGIFIKIRFII